MEEAIAAADRGLKIQPRNSSMMVARCEVRMRIPTELAKARQDCDTAVRFQSKDQRAWYASGLLSLKTNDWARAVRELGAATRTPKGASPTALFGLGIAKLRNGENADGRAYIELARTVYPEVDAELEAFGIKVEQDEAATQGNKLPGMTLFPWPGSGDPSTADEFISRGYYRLERTQLKDALEDLDRATQLAPNSSLAHGMRALILIRLARLDEAEAAVRKAYSCEPVNRKNFQIRGLLHARRGRPEKAIEDLSQDLEADRLESLWFVERGLAYEQTGQLEKARSDFQLAFDFGPSPKRRVLLARVMARLGKVKEAMALIDEAVKKADAANTPPWKKTYLAALDHGIVLKMAGRKDEARVEYDTALQAVNARLAELPAPQGPILRTVGLLRAKADLLLASGRVQEAISVSDDALAVESDSMPMLVARCEALLHVPARLAEARKDCNAVRHKVPSHQQAMFLSGVAYLKSSDWGRAESEFEGIIKLAPRSASALFGRGIARLRRGNKLEGAADIERARSMSAEVDAALGELGITA